MNKRGDAPFRKGKYHHTMVVSGPKLHADAVALNRAAREERRIEVIHAASVEPGVYCEDVDLKMEEVNGNAFRFCKPQDARLANGVEFATHWAHSRSATGKVTRKDAKDPVTRHSCNRTTETGADMSRYSGVQAWLHQDASAPFEFDALYRAFKWATRMRTGFSKTSGTTCCAFITACFQAAAVDHFTRDHRNTAAILALLAELRGEKMPKQERQSLFVEAGPKKKKIALGALREHANPGGFKPHLFGVNDYCRFVTKEVMGVGEIVEELLPSALLVDAKFNCSKNFERMANRRNSGFYRVLQRRRRRGCAQTSPARTRTSRYSPVQGRQLPAPDA
ncbi:hypothetical protein [Mangrovicoccus ximenensis]|uniref:hypothetical protein n=1 Tax=Mangrovicoccus ximenensis TaxID=1911570 RepID=UPI000D3586CA|nr:hypothetical protein [Mangrovicoccus ximenensis]